MDWITLLRSQQADFIQRLKSGNFLHCETVGQHSELTVISGQKLKQLVDFCWEMAEKYKQNNPVRNVFNNNLKGKLGEEVVKIRLADFVTEVDYEKRLGGDGKVDFRLTSDPSVGIQVKTRYGSIDRVQWEISAEEVKKNAVLVCILSQEEFDDRQVRYNLILAGFMPSNMIDSNKGKASFSIADLLYSGGLCSYLESVKGNHEEKMQQLQPTYHDGQPIEQVSVNTFSSFSSKSKLNKYNKIGKLEPHFLPSPLEEFPDLALSIELLKRAIDIQEKIAICGDYDAHGMASTAILLRTLRWLNVSVDYAIPNRMNEGYGINQRIVEAFYREGVKLILTVNNGTSAFEPLARARQLGMKVIIIDYHDIPAKLAPADAILNSKLISESSPYRVLAGVGVVTVLAISLLQQLSKTQGLVKSLLELFTLGILTDIDNPPPLTGINLLWIKRGLQQLPESKLVGIQALMQVRGLSDKRESLLLEDVRFHLVKSIEAVGSISDPVTAVELLITDDSDIALERAIQCEKVNQKCEVLCEKIEREAVAWIEKSQINLEQELVLVIVKHNWHPGVFRIVARRLVERYSVPTFIGTYENENRIRGYGLGISGFHVFQALQSCQDLLGKFGGHKIAGGFSMPAENLKAFQKSLNQFAYNCL